MANLNITASQLNTAQQKIQNKYIYLDLLNQDFQAVDSLEGVCIGGQLSIDATSDMRRSGALEIVVKDSTFNIDPKGDIWLNRFVRVWVGIENIELHDIDKRVKHKVLSVAELNKMTTAIIGDVAEVEFDVQYNNSTTYYQYVNTKTEAWHYIGSKIERTNCGIYIIDAPTYEYNPSTSTLNITLLDLMAFLTGTRKGYITGLTTIFYAGENIRQAMIDTLAIAGFNRYAIDEPESNKGVKTLPNNLEFAQGSTAYDMLKGLGEINPNYEIYFDVNGIFNYHPIPTGNNESVQIENDFLQKMVIDETVSVDFQSVKNAIEVFGRMHDPNYYAYIMSYSSPTISVTSMDFPTTDRWPYWDGIILGFTSSEDIDENNLPADLSWNNYTFNIAQEDLIGRPITSGEYYCVQLQLGWRFTTGNQLIAEGRGLGNFYEAYYQQTGIRISSIDEVGTEYLITEQQNNSVWNWLGHLQAYGYAVDDNAASPFYIAGPTGRIYLPLYDGDYANCLTDNLAQQRAEYELWLRTNLQNQIQLTTTPFYWCDVNVLVSYLPHNEDREAQWLIKSINMGLGPSDTMSIGMMKYYGEGHISAYPLVGLEITRNPANTNVVLGSEVNLSGLIVTAIYEDGSTYNVTNDGNCFIHLENQNDLIVQSLGANAVIAEYSELNYETGELITKTASFNVTGVALTNIAITNPPDRVEYPIGTSFSTRGMIVTAYYSNGGSSILGINEYTYNPTSVFDTAGSQTITITCVKGQYTKTATLQVTVTQPLTSISVSGNYQTNYIVGDMFNTNGMVVTAYYGEGVSQTSKVVTNYTYDPQYLFIAGSIPITISFTDGVTKTANINVTVSNDEMSYIYISRNPNKLIYTSGTAIDLSGIQIMGVYLSGREEIVSYTNYSPTTATQTQITVYAAGFSTSFAITIQEAEVQLTNNNYNSYVSITQPSAYKWLWLTNTTYYVGGGISTTGGGAGAVPVGGNATSVWSDNSSGSSRRMSFNISGTMNTGDKCKILSGSGAVLKTYTSPNFSDSIDQTFTKSGSKILQFYFENNGSGGGSSGSIALSNPTYFSGGVSGATALIGYESSKNRNLRYTLTPSFSTTSLTFDISASFYSGTSSYRTFGIGISTSSTAYSNAGASTVADGTFTLNSNGSATVTLTKNLSANTTYYLFIYPKFSNYSVFSVNSASLTAQGSSGTADSIQISNIYYYN